MDADEKSEDPQSYVAQNFTGLLGAVRRVRFQRALQLARRYGSRLAVDYGCANGVFLPALSREYHTVIGYDVDIWWRPAAERSLVYPNVKLAWSQDELAQRLEGRRADAVFCLEVIEHVAPAARPGLLAHMHELLSPYGNLFLSMPIEVGPMAFAKEVYRFARGNYPAGRDIRTLAKAVFLQHGLAQTDLRDHFAFDFRAVVDLLAGRFVVEEARYLPLDALGLLAPTVMLRARPCAVPLPEDRPASPAPAAANPA